MAPSAEWVRVDQPTLHQHNDRIDFPMVEGAVDDYSEASLIRQTKKGLIDRMERQMIRIERLENENLELSANLEKLRSMNRQLEHSYARLFGMIYLSPLAFVALLGWLR